MYGFERTDDEDPDNAGGQVIPRKPCSDYLGSILTSPMTTYGIKGHQRSQFSTAKSRNAIRRYPVYPAEHHFVRKHHGVVQRKHFRYLIFAMFLALLIALMVIVVSVLLNAWIIS
jgi:hypothetical protein